MTPEDERLVGEIALRMADMALNHALSIQSLAFGRIIISLVGAGALTKDEATAALTKAADENSLRLTRTDNPFAKVMNASVEQYVADLLSKAESLQFGDDQ